MSNKHRIEEPGASYHINANALDGMALYRDEVDRLRFFDLFADEVEKSDWTILEYTFMTTHYHVLLTLNKCTLSSGFQRLQSRYARSYNRRHHRRGVVWQERFHDEMVETESHLFEAVRYVALNAPRARMVDAPEDWPWCSYGAAIGRHGPDLLVDEQALLGLFSEDPDRARRKLQAYVEEKDPRVRWRQSRLGGSSDAQQ
ncbi:MAG TPA: transposase [Gaiellaceae bacterium]|nr:transposase [Gaiellaceae bacterium]